MNGPEVFKFATRMIGPSCRQALNHGRHDDGGRSTGSCRTRPTCASSRLRRSDMKLPIERFVVNIENYANTSAASIPLAMAEWLDDGRMKPTDRLLLVSFGAGMTWAVGGAADAAGAGASGACSERCGGSTASSVCGARHSLISCLVAAAWLQVF
jgi:3-oxoacyl-[acyl-carrier-protein] synthase III